jgi:anti-sigma-K factor RskA
MNIKEYISSGIIELYVMGLCSPEEEQEIEQFRVQYPELHTAILQYEKDMEEKMLQQGVLPPAAADEAILHRLESLSAPVVSMHNKVTPVKNINRLRAIAASVAILLGISAYFNYTLYQKNKKQQTLISTAQGSPLPASDYAVITNPAITPVAMYGVGSHSICRCTMFWDKNTGKAYIMIHHLPKSSSSRDYQLWAEVNGKMISVGIINDEIRGRFIEVPQVPYGSIAFKVTLENAGGANNPTLSETYLEGKI